MKKDFQYILHGGDYNPDQWLHVPGIIDQDFDLMKKASCNTFSIGIFSWSQLEVEEGVFDFSWLDDLFRRAEENHIQYFLATPSAARPAWLGQKHPDTGIVDSGLWHSEHRMRWASRQSACLSNAYFQERVRIIDEKLAERYGKHPALAGWHISNEYCTVCYCRTCLEKFYEYLRNKYQTLENLNQCYWTPFWGHRLTDWNQIHPLDCSITGVVLDWNRFVTENTCNFFKMEIEAVRKYSDRPVTTNMMGLYGSLDYWRLAKDCDFIADDCYPTWYPGITDKVAANFAALHDMHYAMKQKPFIIMECCPGIPQYKPYMRMRRPNEFQREMLLALGHGADGTMYFQWRRGLGGCEQQHGAVVGHDASDKTLMFKDVADYGSHLKNITEITGSQRKVEAAIMLDWDTRWSDTCMGGFSGKEVRKFDETVFTHYQALWQKNIEMDVIEESCDFTPYKLIIAPMLYCLKNGVMERIQQFVENGGTFVMTYLSAYTDEYGRCIPGGFPGGKILRKVFGIWNEDMDGLTPETKQSLLWNGKDYPVVDYAEYLHAEGAEVLATYQHEFYAGTPAVTVNHFGKGRAVYIGARTGLDFLLPFYEKEALLAGCKPVLEQIPESLRVSRRIAGDGSRYYFILNMTDSEQRWSLPEPMVDIWNGKTEPCEQIVLPSAGSTILKKQKV